MKIQISYNNFKEKFVIPVNPETYQINGGGTSFTDITVIKGGERTIIGDKKLENITFASFFPSKYVSDYCNYKKLKKPWKTVKMINKWRRSGDPVRLLISGTNINMYCTITQFDVEERGGEPGDLYYTITFKKFVFVKLNEVKKKSNKKEERPNTKQRPKKYKVVKGDCLINISKKIYGKGSDYTKIYNANKNLIKNPNFIQIGWELKIP